MIRFHVLLGIGHSPFIRSGPDSSIDEEWLCNVPSAGEVIYVKDVRISVHSAARHHPPDSLRRRVWRWSFLLMRRFVGWEHSLAGGESHASG